MESLKKSDIVLKSVPNLVDVVWGEERPARPSQPVALLDVQYAGKSSQEKQAEIAEKLKTAEYEALLVTTLDDIAWMTNMRGTDIDYNPVFFSYMLFYPKRGADESRVTLFVDETKVTDVRDYLTSQKIEVRPYLQITEQLTEYSQNGIKVGVITESCNAELFRICGEHGVKADNVIQKTKAVKNAVEMAGMRNSNRRDCAAIIKYFAFLEEELRKEDHDLDEWKAARVLDDLRTHGEHHRGPSFPSISSIGANGAVIHYEAEQHTAVKLNNNEIYLLDSGGQYLDGTVDITRTTHFGGNEPTAF